MGVYAKDMEMPTSCLSCPLQGGTADCRLTQKTYNWGLSERPSDCPLVPVPEHGRLIDADKIGLTDFEIILCQKGNPFKNALEMLLEKIENAPTFIPADESDMDSFIHIFEEDDEEDETDSFI